MTATWHERLIAIQNQMKVRLDHTPPTGPLRFVAGCDLTVKEDVMMGCFVVVDVENECRSVYSKCTRVEVDVPYIPGLFCFREGPVVLRCLRECQRNRPDIRIDVLLVDGQGVWHPRGFGLACYVGVECGIPTIGVAKQFLHVGSRHCSRRVNSDAQDRCPNWGDVMLLRHVLDDGVRIECAVMRTSELDPFQPIFVSQGHRMDLATAIRVVRDVCYSREPEPLRLADRISRRVVRKILRKHR
jgi:deoxyinosine 3'endonuclease (endonuclease V)